MTKPLPSSVQFVKGVGPSRAELLGKLGIETVEDLLYFFPRDYEDRRELTKIKYIQPEQVVTIQGRVVNKSLNQTRSGRSILKVSFTDDTDVVNGVWFNQPYLKKKFEEGDWYFLSGEVNKKSWYRYQKKEIVNPVYEKIEQGESIHTGRVVPIYPLTKGLPQKRMREIVYKALEDYVVHFDEFIPHLILEELDLPGIAESLKGFHFPRDRQHYIRSRRRLAFEELFLLQLLMLERKQEALHRNGIPHQPQPSFTRRFIDSLPFSLTGAQNRAWQEIKEDMEQEIPMQRLLQGDVGSGKTVVAALSLIKAMAGGYQGVFMAPTEILAEQHYLNLKQLLSPLGFNIELLVGSRKPAVRREIEEKIKNQDIDLIIGTHALFQEGVEYSQVGLAVIDEQHRFGVEQRFNLKNKGDNPDLLVMTATPIPRSLALTFYGDLDLSIIDEMPPGRKPVQTSWRYKNARSRIYDFVRGKLEQGRQAFVVCPLIEESEELEAVSAEEMRQELTANYLSNYRIGILHSQLTSADKKQTMEQFRQGQIDVLVSTTVIEVGVDVPNASLMIIENAERFGLAQLHQLRGRVGRGQYKSYCILIADPGTEEARQRLDVITGTNDGFQIAEEDLKIRGPGEFFGTRQHGIPDLKVASLVKDQKLLGQARRQAQKVIKDSEWREKYPGLAEKLRYLELKV